jgi:gp16 family phage-associated protein
MSKTAAQFRSELIAKGMTLPEWAKSHGFPIRSVRAVLYGHNKGHFGQSHRIAVALGLKDQPK